MDMFDFAGLLFGGSRTAPDATTVTATGAGASDGGEVGITLDADVTPAEDTGVEVDADQTVIDLPTSPDVDEGDEVIVTLVGDGPIKTPVVTANPGSGDRMRALATSAKTVADAAQAVAEAVNQHFFADTNGIHVTEATQEEWDESPTGANVLINSIGQLFRDGLNNLLTLTTENGARSLTVWDGLGNTADHIRAIIGETIQLGNRSSGNYLTLDDTGLEIHNDTVPNTFAAKIGPAIVRLLGDTLNIETGIGGGTESTFFDSIISHTVGKTSFIRLRTSKHRYIESDVASSITLHADAIVLDGITTGDRFIASGNANVALAASTSSGNMNRGLWDETGGKWIIYQHTSSGIVIGSGASDHLYHHESTCTVTTSNATIIGDTNHCWHNNAVCTVLIGVNLKSSLANGSAVAIATAPANFRPPYTVVGSVYVTSQNVNAQAWIDSSGKITVNNRSGSAINTSAKIYISFTFAL